jgi:hypothetical protein
MKYLLYCIIENYAGGAGNTPPGVDGRPVHIIGKNDLATAVSIIDSVETSFDIYSIIAYHKVVESFHCHCPTVPLRFGTFLEGKNGIELLLDRQRERYKKLLKELAGRVEMGMKVIIEDTVNPTITPIGSFPLCAAEHPGPGAAYLFGRKAHYSMESSALRRGEGTIARYRTFFAGLYAGFKGQVSALEGRCGGEKGSILVSLYFLVPKDSLTAFRKAFAELKSRESGKLMLTGPWPPYNFVLPADC